MSTYINITVGKNGLKEKAKQQTNANRQAKLEADARAKAEAEGKRQRDLERAKQGLGPDGEPLYGVPTKAPAYKEEPAAFRFPGYEVSHCLLEELGQTTVSDTTIERNYRIYSADLSASLAFGVAESRAPQPTKKWGLSSYNVQTSYDFSNAEWSAGYSTTPGSDFIPGLGYARNTGGSSIARTRYLASEEGTSHLYNYYSSTVLNVRYTEPLTLSNVAWWNSGAYITNIGDSFRTAIRRASQSLQKVLCFPAANSTCVLCLISYTSDTAHYFGRRVKLSCRAKSATRQLISDDGDFGSTAEEMAQGAGPFAFYFSKWQYGAYEELEELVDSFDEYMINEQAVVKTFLVGIRSVKELTPPAAFRAAITSLYPIMAGNITYAKSIVSILPARALTGFYTSWFGPPDGNDYNPYGGTSQWWDASQESDTRWPQSVGDDQFALTTATSLGVAPGFDSYNFNAPNGGDPKLFGPRVVTYAIEDYGLESLSADRYSYSDNAFAAGMFSLLSKAAEILDITYSSPAAEDITDYMSLPSTYLDGSPAPRFSLDRDPYIEDATRIYDYRIVRNPREAQASMRVFTKNFARDYSISVPDLSGKDLYSVWNWGQAGYCVSQLKSLGFTDADLTP